MPRNITVSFVEASMSPEEAYRRMVDGSNCDESSVARPVPSCR